MQDNSPKRAGFSYMLKSAPQAKARKMIIGIADSKWQMANCNYIQMETISYKLYAIGIERSEI